MMSDEEYDRRHYELAGAIAEFLEGSGCTGITHWYDYESFGSWTLSFARSGQRFQLLYDGKDFFIYIRRRRQGSRETDESYFAWEDVAYLDCDDGARTMNVDEYTYIAAKALVMRHTRGSVT